MKDKSRSKSGKRSDKDESNSVTEEKVYLNVPIDMSLYEKVKKKAILNNKDVNEYAGVLVAKGSRKRTERDPEKLVAMVALQQKINELMDSLDDQNDADIKEQIKDAMEVWLRLWVR